MPRKISKSKYKALSYLQERKGAIRILFFVENGFRKFQLWYASESATPLTLNDFNVT
jgi:hypothetical protein